MPIIATLAAQVGMERQRDGRWFVSACGGYNTYDAAVWPLTSGDLTWETFVRNLSAWEISRLCRTFRTRGKYYQGALFASYRKLYV